jgi:hypothetical protein
MKTNKSRLDPIFFLKREGDVVSRVRVAQGAPFFSIFIFRMNFKPASTFGRQVSADSLRSLNIKMKDLTLLSVSVFWLDRFY